MPCPDLDFKLGFKHRTITHSAWMLINWLIPALGLGITLHILLDLLTKKGCQLLYPKKEWFILLGAPLSTGKHDLLISSLLIGGLIL